MSEKETIFREGDKVFDPTYEGWGVVENIRLESIVVRFGSFDLAVRFSFENAEKKLSFTEYDYVNGGFSQERPMPTISMPYLSNKWKYIAKDRVGVYIYHNKPKWSAKLGYFVHQIGGHAKVNSIICASLINAEFNTIYKIIDNDQST